MASRVPLWNPPPATGPTSVKKVDSEIERARRRNAKTDSFLRMALGYIGLGILVVQLAAVNYVFFRYAISYDWKPPEGALAAWFGVTLGQIFIVVRVLARYLFPPIDQTGTPADRA